MLSTEDVHVLSSQTLWNCQRLSNIIRVSCTRLRVIARCFHGIPFLNATVLQNWHCQRSLSYKTDIRKYSFPFLSSEMC
jgi:hypothetical protein